MIRISGILFFLLTIHLCYSQVNYSEKKSQIRKNSIQEDTTQQKIIVWISYEVGEDSLAHNIKYFHRPNLPQPTDEMIQEAIRIVSEMKLKFPPQKDSSGQNRKMFTKIAFTPNKEKVD